MEKRRKFAYDVTEQLQNGFNRGFKFWWDNWISEWREMVLITVIAITTIINVEDKI